MTKRQLQEAKARFSELLNDVGLSLDMRYALRLKMIRSIRHKGLKRLYEEDDPRGVISQHAEELRDILARLDAAATVADMDLPGFRLHPLKGELKGLIFPFADRDASDVDYVDYH